ncbi:MAG TPA: zinc ribbon domain-containing protein [Frankiaceae bacterium]|nr:zinc ribbon domain-containing protein [Frankiaceae bacterium]
MKPVLAPQPTTDDLHYWDGIAAGQLLLQRCSQCQTMRHPPRPMCGVCNSLSWDAFPSDCRATVISWIIPRHPPVAEGDEQLIALVETTEGARLVVNLRDFPIGESVNDARIEIFMHDVGDGVILPQGRPLGASVAPGEVA